MQRREFLTTLGAGALLGATVGFQVGRANSGIYHMPIVQTPTRTVFYGDVPRWHPDYGPACAYSDVLPRERGEVVVAVDIVQADKTRVAVKRFDDLKEGDVFACLWPKGYEGEIGSPQHFVVNLSDAARFRAECDAEINPENSLDGFMTTSRL